MEKLGLSLIPFTRGSMGGVKHSLPDLGKDYMLIFYPALWKSIYQARNFWIPLFYQIQWKFKRDGSSNFYSSDPCIERNTFDRYSALQTFIYCEG